LNKRFELKNYRPMALKNLILAVGVSLGATLTAFSGVNTVNYTVGTTILDGNLNPWSDSRTVTGADAPYVGGLSLRLYVSGGFMGDLYGYLSHDGVMVPILNRPGVGSSSAFGYGDSVLQVTFEDSAANNIHFYQSVGGSTIGNASWQPDGRAISPLSSPSAFDASGTSTFAAFNGTSANGLWTLVLADVSAGGGSSTVVSWGMDITAVPEPVNVALAVFGTGFGLIQLWRMRRGRNSPSIPVT